MPVFDFSKLHNAMRKANTSIEHLRVLLFVASRERGFDDKFERLNQSANYNFDLLTRQIAASKAALIEQIQIQKTNPQPGGKEQLKALGAQIKEMEQVAMQFKKYQDIQIQKRNEYLLKQAPKIPRQPTTKELIKRMPHAPTIDPLMALLRAAKASTLDPEIGGKIKYIQDTANEALRSVTEGMSARQLEEFKLAMNDNKSNPRRENTQFYTLDPIITLMKINPSKLDPEIGEKVKTVQDAIKNAYIDVTKELKGDEKIKFNLELKKDQEAQVNPESRSSFRR